MVCVTISGNNYTTAREIQALNDLGNQNAFTTDANGNVRFLKDTNKNPIPIDESVPDSPADGPPVVVGFNNDGSFRLSDGSSWTPSFNLASGSGASSPSIASPASEASNDEDYAVVRDDTVWDIADGDRALVEAIVARNNLQLNDNGSPIIVPGQHLVIPDLSGVDDDTRTDLAHAGGDLIANNTVMTADNLSEVSCCRFHGHLVKVFGGRWPRRNVGYIPGNLSLRRKW